MVSKIAVMALVAVVAVPILLGYGLNVQTETYSGWEEDGLTNNYTNYLASIEDSTKRNYTDADIYQFNSDIFWEYAAQTYPVYEKVSTTKTPVALNQEYLSPSGNPLIRMSERYSQGVIGGMYDASNYYSITISFSGGGSYTFDHLKAWYWTSNGSVGSIDIVYTEPGPNGGYVDATNYSNIVSVSTSYTGSPAGYWKGWIGTSSNTYADVSKGYRLNTDYGALADVISNPSAFRGHGFGITGISPAGICRDILFTFNLDSVTQSDYVMGIRLNDRPGDMHLYLKKETTGAGVQWSYSLGDSDFIPIYHNPDLSSNTYQLYLTIDGGEFRYVGAWSDSIAEMPALITYSFTFDDEPYRDYFGNTIDVYGLTPIMRIDRASVAAYEYKIIRDTTFNPFEFKTNPITKLTYVQEVGTSLEFGGITFNVEDGKITVDSQSVSLAGIQLSSTFNGNAYENTINGKLVSTTLAPSSVVFNGDWVVQVTATAQKHVEKESTSWVPGKFAWNGVDDNFLIAGLMTCIAAFIGLGLYARRSGAKVLPLMLVCGGAAFMFILML